MALSLCLSREAQEAGIYTRWVLVQASACDLEAARPWYNNDIIDLRNRVLEYPNSWKTGFLRIGEVGPSRIPKMKWQTHSDNGSNFMR